MIQIQFLDRNVVHALVPVFSMKPEKVIFLYDKDCVTHNLRQDISDTIKHRYPKTAMEFVQADMLHMHEIKRVLETVVEKYKDKEIQVDITGGTEIMTACGMMAAQQFGWIPTYVDYDSSEVFQVFTLEKLADVEHITIEDYLRAIGGRVLSVSSCVPKEKEFEKLCGIAKAIFANERKWDEFFSYISRGYSSRGVMEFSMGEKKNDPDCRFILNLFLDNGYAIKIGNDCYRYASEAAKTYMTVSGIWLELYIYMMAKQVYDEVYMSVNIDWNDRDSCESRDNEIDVVIMHHSQPVFISCKMKPIVKETVYEVYAMAKRMGGDIAKAMVATTDPLRKKEAENFNRENGILMRMEKMKVGFIEADDFQHSAPKEVFRKALHKIKCYFSDERQSLR